MFAVARKTLFFSAIISIRSTTISSACGANSTFLHQDIVTLMEKITQHTAMVVKRSKIDIFKDNMCHIGEVPNQLHDFAIVANIPGL